MSFRRSLASCIVLLALVPATVAAQSELEAAITDSAMAELAALGLLIYAVYVAFSIAIGVLILAVSEFFFSDSYVRAIEKRIYDHPGRSGAIGLGAISGGFVGIILLMIVLLLLVEFGVPESLGLVVAIPVFGGMLFLCVAATIGTIVLGSYLLRRLGDGESNLWLALVVGALVVNIPVLNFVLAFLVLFLGTGAMVGQWWNNQRGGSSGPNSQRPLEG